ncbi:MAG TPA: alkaline phosphatase family protein [Thermoplasmata archaeon]|nr:alkaline phosphatase family protein [Thermoplasmata archaeon]
MPAPLRRHLVLGLDGATFDLLDPLMAAGDLPYLSRLAREGRRARLTSVFPPKTIPAWYSFATGKDPGELGIFGFTEPDGGPGRSKIVQTFRPAEALWDTLSRRGVRVGVLNFPLRGGYPLNGFVVPGMLTEQPATYPESLRAELERVLGRPYLPELPPYRDSERASWLALARQAVDQHARAAEHLISRFHPEFLFVLFRETDRVQHQHWSELDRPVSRIPRDLREFFHAVDSSVERIDRAFIADGAPATTLIVSDHGHGAARADFFTNRWLAEQGFLVFREGRDRDSLRRRFLSRVLIASDRVGLGRTVIRPLADRLRGESDSGWVGRVVGGDSSFESMASRIDWERTVAYSYPVPEGIYLNRYNPHLTLEEGRAAVTEIRRRLESFREARIEVMEPREIYRGSRLQNAPALLVRIDDLATEPRMDFSYPSPMLRKRPEFFYGSGVHRMAGILLARQSDGGTPALSEELTLLDMAPMILGAMGVSPLRGDAAPVPPGVGG